MIVLSDTIKVTTEYTGKSKYDFWKNIRKGDILTIAMELRIVGKYVPTLVISNGRTSETFRDSLNSLQNYLYKMGYETN